MWDPGLVTRIAPASGGQFVVSVGVEKVIPQRALNFAPSLIHVTVERDGGTPSLSPFPAPAITRGVSSTFFVRDGSDPGAVLCPTSWGQS
jgi:hypothetical protein